MYKQILDHCTSNSLSSVSRIRALRAFEPSKSSEKTGDVVLVIAVERTRRVVLDRALQALEEVLVVDDVAVLLVVAVEPVRDWSVVVLL